MNSIMPRLREDQLAMFPLDLPPAAYPDLPGHRGVDTSAAAAEGLTPKLARLQRLTLDAIARTGAAGLTAHELADVTGLPREAAQPRISECRKKGLVVDSGRRRFNASGKRAIVWTVPEHKCALAAEPQAEGEDDER